MRMFPRGRDSAVDASGFSTVTPVSRTNVVVTMKTISMMKTMSSIGVMLISGSSCVACLRAIRFSSSPLFARHHVFELLGLDRRLAVQVRGEVDARQCRDHAGHRRDR